MIISCRRESQVLEAFRKEARFKLGGCKGRWYQWQGRRDGKTDDNKIETGGFRVSYHEFVIGCCFVFSNGVCSLRCRYHDNGDERISPWGFVEWIQPRNHCSISSLNPTSTDSNQRGLSALRKRGIAINNFLTNVNFHFTTPTPKKSVNHNHVLHAG